MLLAAPPHLDPCRRSHALRPNSFRDFSLEPEGKICKIYFRQAGPSNSFATKGRKEHKEDERKAVCFRFIFCVPCVLLRIMFFLFAIPLIPKI
jgi:hypothetical protein